MLQQLPLNVRLKDNESFDTYYPGQNGAVIHTLGQMASGQGDQQLYLWGGRQSGKTHLLHAACHEAGKSGRASLLLKAEDLLQYGPAVFEGLEQLALVCIDDLQHIVGNAAWERALFNFINDIRLQNGVLVMAAEANPGEIGVQLPDLRSRLEWGGSLPVATIVGRGKNQGPAAQGILPRL